MKSAAALCALACTSAERAEDLVTGIPGFPDAKTWGFKAYSGYLDVPGPINGYDALRIHYQFHTSQGNPSSDPVAIWHQGGPGGASSFGLYTEMGAFLVGDAAHGRYMNPWAWNRVANMLYMDSPAGSGAFSQCLQGGEVVACSWDDRSQGEAYAHSLQAFYKAFPEFAKNDLYLTGESYFGQYGPNIAHFILNNEPFASQINLKGIAAGNACWGGTENCVACNGPSNDKIDVDLFFGKALFSPKLKQQIDKTCDFPTDYTAASGECTKPVNDACQTLLRQMRQEVGPHNTYFIYDNCPQTEDFLQRVGKDSAWLTGMLRRNLHGNSTRQVLKDMNGGFDWDCIGDLEGFLSDVNVLEALHLGARAGSAFQYGTSGPASVTLWPELAKKLRVLIYNGDADACVPYNGNEDWIGSLEEQGKLTEIKEWAPWFTSNEAAPAGYVTRYQAPGASVDFSFQTIRLAGHMVPTFQPEAGYVMIRDFFKDSTPVAVV